MQTRRRERMNAIDIDERRSPHGLVLAVAPSTIARIALIAFAFLAVWFAGNVLVVIFAGILFGVLLRAAADWIQQRTGLGARSSYLLLVLAIAVVLGSLTWALGPRIVEQAAQIEQTIPTSIEQARQQLNQRPWGGYLISTIAQPLDSDEQHQ